MEEIDIAWAAGLYEGEGWCELTYAQTVPGAARRMRLNIGMTDRDVLAKLEKIFGGTVIDKPRNGGTQFSNAKPMWVWRLASVTEVVEAVNCMWPYLASRRRSQLQPLLDAAALMPPPGTSGKSHCKQGHPLVPENLIPRTEGLKKYMRCRACYKASWQRHNEKLKAARQAALSQ